jgi:hypothetical protein
MKKARPLLVVIISVSLIACAGKTAKPVASYKVGDDQMSCNELKAEMAHIDARVSELIPDSEKTGKNVALGVAGWFLIVPWFFMDFSDAEKVEIEAYQSRYLALEKSYSKKSCSKEPRLDTADASTDDVSKKLEVLKKLHTEGVISDDEHAAQRKDVLQDI